MEDPEVARDWPYHLPLPQLQEYNEVEADRQAERAQVRLTSFYHQMFPDLIDEDNPLPEDRIYSTNPHSQHFLNPFLSPSSCAANLPPIPAEEIHRGWDSQPKVICLYFCIIWLISEQEFDYELEVEGEIPNDLKGTLFRNGPGLLEVYGTPLVHPIDGDGMVQKLSCI